MVLVIDLDSTIIDTCRCIINLHNKLNDKQIIYTDNYSWNFYPMVKTKEELSELFKLFDHEEFYNNETLVVLDGAINIINELSKNNKVIICSKHDIIRRSITSKWVQETFPNVDLIFTDTFDKSIVGHVTLIVDDKLEALESVNADYKILYGLYDWNRNINMLRATNWEELYNMIKTIGITISDNKLNEELISRKMKVGDNER